MPRWHNPPLRVYHGTDTTALGGSGHTAGSSVVFRVQLTKCRPFTDFGLGFYVTTNLHQARMWANAKVIRTPSASSIAVVLEFAPDRDALAGLETLSFVRPIRDFWNLVHDCRNGFTPHQRSGGGRPYDIVYGPVTLWPSILTIQDCDQISFHTRNALNVLGIRPNIIDIAPADTFPT